MTAATQSQAGSRGVCVCVRLRSFRIDLMLIKIVIITRLLRFIDALGENRRLLCCQSDSQRVGRRQPPCTAVTIPFYYGYAQSKCFFVFELNGKNGCINITIAYVIQ